MCILPHLRPSSIYEEIDQDRDRKITFEEVSPPDLASAALPLLCLLSVCLQTPTLDSLASSESFLIDGRASSVGDLGDAAT